VYAKEKKRKRKMLTNVVTVLKLEIEIFRLSVKRLRYTTLFVRLTASAFDSKSEQRHVWQRNTHQQRCRTPQQSRQTPRQQRQPQPRQQRCWTATAATVAWRIGRTDGRSCDASQGCSSSPYTHDMHVCCGSAAPADICYTATDLAHTAQHTHATHHML
jgi:hypothetical protein